MKEKMEEKIFFCGQECGEGGGTNRGRTTSCHDGVQQGVCGEGGTNRGRTTSCHDRGVCGSCDDGPRARFTNPEPRDVNWR